MKILILYAHPDPSSFNHVVLQELTHSLKDAGHQLILNDLYSAQFSPVMTLENLQLNTAGQENPNIIEQQKLVKDAQGLLFIYPVWWYGPPAILKGWIEKTLTLKFAFDIQTNATSQAPIGLLQDKIAFVVETTASDKQALDQLSYHPPIPNVLKFCGIENQTTKTLYAVPYVDKQQRKQMLEETKQQCLECFHW